MPWPSPARWRFEDPELDPTIAVCLPDLVREFIQHCGLLTSHFRREIGSRRGFRLADVHAEFEKHLNRLLTLWAGFELSPGEMLEATRMPTALAAYEAAGARKTMPPLPVFLYALWSAEPDNPAVEKLMDRTLEAVESRCPVCSDARKLERHAARDLWGRLN